MKLSIELLLFLLAVQVARFTPVKDVTSIPYKCPFGCKANVLSSDKINVHLISHSHDDVGWLQTYSGYYYGSKDFTSYKTAGVRYILDSTIAALKSNPNRTYIQVETAFFWKWWAHQTEETQKDVVNLVNTGQLEIINGAWSMNDEAAAHYHSIIDQFTWGFRILDETLGTCARPRIGWQIDPFGHSREHASLIKQMGFEGLVLGRIDYRDKEQRKIKKNLDFNWQTSANFENSEIFTTIFHNFYTYEDKFCFDVTCKDNITEETLKDQVDAFAKLLDTYITYYQTSNIMMPMGQDFSFQVAEQNFKGSDLLIKGFEDHDTYNVFYSTPSCYIQSVKEEVTDKKLTLSVKTDDFFPYASDSNAYWTGYFSSRPSSKRFERLGNNILQSSKQLTTFSRILGQEYDDKIIPLRTAMGIMQHHDAITGTEKQAVADDYARLLDAGIRGAEEPVGAILGNLLKVDEKAMVDLKLSTCLLANISVCDITQKDKILVAVQNPLSRQVTHYVRLPVEGTNYKITGPDGEVEFDVLDSISTFDYLKDILNTASKELVFAAKDLPPLGVRLYYIEKVDDDDDSNYIPYQELTTDDESFGSDTDGFSIDTTSGQLSSITLNKIKQTVKQEFLYYNGSIDSINSGSHRASGAYIFEPVEQEAKLITDKFLSTKFAKGKLADEVIQYIDSEITQIIRVYKATDDPHIEFDWLIGDLQNIESQGREIITRFTVDKFLSKSVFYTDSNGREQIKRELNKRSDYAYDATIEPVTSNYYPVTSKITIKDETQKLTVAVLNDRSQGGTSLSEGQIELMVHRKLKRDDGFGVEEILNEQQYDKGLYIRGQHFFTFAESTSAAGYEKDLAHRKLLAPWVLVADGTSEELSTLEKVQALVKFEFAGIQSSLNPCVQILTLEPWKDSYLLRLEHVMEKDEDVTIANVQTVNLEDLFTLFNIKTIKETTLGANLDLETDVDLSNITLNPMQVRTFIITTDKMNEGGKGLSDGTEHDGDGDDDDNSSSTTLANDDNNNSSSTTLAATPLLVLLATTFYMNCRKF